MFQTPVLFIIFNRPDTTQQVFKVIRQIKPKYFFIFADGPRYNKVEDIEKCEKARKVVNQIDWDCDLKTLFREENLGCGIGPSSAISWFFEQVDEGIILEDDCLPHPDFFPFCKELLDKFRHNPMILSITGSNFQDSKKRGNASYYFSVHNRIWGWATWKRTWENYDYFLKNINENEFLPLVKSLFRYKCEQVYWSKVYKCSKTTQTDNSAWDFQFMFLQWKLGGLTVTPNTNLISNIGFGDDATHTPWGKNNPSLNRSTAAIYPVVHPDKIERNRKADEYYFFKFIKPKSNLMFRIRRKIKKILTLKSWKNVL
jgi:hypothetical protein